MVVTAGLQDTLVDDLVSTAKTLRAEFAQTAASVDERGEMPYANLQRLYDLGFFRLPIPVEYGGLATSPSLHWQVSKFAEILTELAAGESSTAQVWMVHTNVVRKLFSGLTDLPDATLAQLAHEVLHEGARFISSAAETNKQRLSFRTSGQRVPGGLLVNGTKYFGTGSDGARYGVVPLLLDGYASVEEAVEIANDTDYGLAAYVHAADPERAREVASQLRAGQVSINGAFDSNAPFGGYKMSGNGREWGDYAFHEFLETKAVLGWTPAPQA